ncbi:ArsR/SmtB family transcription factor [Nocardioides sp. SYSU DS0651]|uniref:ArsR/SmtB family transcription factor n=1 Tax=Nocardioides sp. SYSU DS0651 TaxID=3415955 RepID=UPI003F4C67BB
MDVFAALADPVRRALLRQLAEGPARVVDLAARHDISRPAISKHLRLLVEAGVVTATERGRERHHRLRPEALQPVAELLAALAPAPRVPEHVLDALDLEVRRVGRSRRERDATQPSTEQEETG